MSFGNKLLGFGAFPNRGPALIEITLSSNTTNYSLAADLQNNHDETGEIETKVLTESTLTFSTDPSIIHQFVEHLPAMDSKFIRGTYKILNPTAQLEHDYTCVHCGHDGTVEVPINPTFFWPDR